MSKPDLVAMDFEELWLLHEELTKVLSEKIVVEKRELEDRLAKLNRVEIIRGPGSAHPLRNRQKAGRPQPAHLMLRTSNNCENVTEFNRYGSGAAVRGPL